MRSSFKSKHLEFVSAIVVMSLISMIVSIRRKDGGRFKEEYLAELD